jgi:hypothetical protein
MFPCARIVSVAPIEEQRVDGLVALQVDDAKQIAGRQLVRPALPCRQRDVDRRRARVETALHHAEAHRTPAISTA